MSQVDILPEPSRRIGWGLAALVVAGLVADGVTTVSGAHHVDRGYDRFERQLQRLGADVVREPDEPLFG